MALDSCFCWCELGSWLNTIVKTLSSSCAHVAKIVWQELGDNQVSLCTWENGLYLLSCILQLCLAEEFWWLIACNLILVMGTASWVYRENKEQYCDILYVTAALLCFNRLGPGHVPSLWMPSQAVTQATSTKQLDWLASNVQGTSALTETLPLDNA